MLRVILLCLIAALAGFKTGQAGAQQPAETLDRLTGAFDAAVFGPADYRRSSMLRIAGPVRIEAWGALTPARQAILDRLAGDLAGLTDLPVAAEPGQGRPGPIRGAGDGGHIFQLHILPRGHFRALLAGQTWVSARTAEILSDQMCAFVTFGRETINGGLILIDAKLPPATIAHCLVEEVAQSFGPVWDTDLLDPSAFNDYGGLVDRLQPDDRLILAALYDQRLAPGMARDAVLAELPSIWADLLAVD